MDRNSDDSQMNDDSSDTNTALNDIDGEIKTAGKQTTNTSTYPLESLNGIDRTASPNLATNKKGFNANTKKSVKKVRQR